MADLLIEHVDLPVGAGWYDPGEQVILLDRTLSQAERRSALAHELEHVLAEDEDISGVSRVLAMRQEARAQTRAARKLIPLAALIGALLWSMDEFELAEELRVDVNMLRCRLATLSEDEHQEIDRRLWEVEGHLP